MSRFEVHLNFQYIGQSISNIWRTLQYFNVPLGHAVNSSPQFFYAIAACKEEEEKIEAYCTLITKDPISTAITTKNEESDKKSKESKEVFN